MKMKESHENVIPSEMFLYFTVYDVGIDVIPKNVLSVYNPAIQCPVVDSKSLTIALC